MSWVHDTRLGFAKRRKLWRILQRLPRELREDLKEIIMFYEEMLDEKEDELEYVRAVGEVDAP